LTFGQGVALPIPEHLEGSDPITLFEDWFNDAKKSGLLLPEAMSVSSVSRDGQPSSRMVLLKSFDQDGFVFYTNYGSRKSQEIEENGKVALLFHWSVLQRQVRIEGTLEKISKEESEKYFHSRDKGSQIGAWASKQSQKLKHNDELKERVKAFEDKFAGEDQIPLPEFWGGWRIKPHYIEFWQGRASRLHDRLCFEQVGESWQHFKLHP